MTREEQWLGAIAGMDGVTPPSMPVWHYEQMLAAIYDAVVGASPAREFPERSWHLDEFLWAVYCAVAGLADPGIPAPTCRIEEFWRGIYLKAMNDEDAAVPTPVWRIEEFLAEVFNNLTTAELKTVTGTMLHVLDALAKPAEELLVDLSPIQDLHGYSSPWPAGGGKNLLPLTVDGIKSENAGTWVDNTYSNNGVTFTILTDNSGNVIGIQASGTATGSNASLRLPLPTNISVGDSVVLNGNPRQSTPATRIWVGTSQYADIAADIGLGTTFTYSESVARIWVQVMRDNTVNGVIYTPMIRLSTETDATFSPYSNICPITGRTGVTVYVSPTPDPGDATTYSSDWTSPAGTVYGGTLDVVTGVLTVDRAQISSYAGETLPGAWISDRDAYAAGTTPTTGAQVVYELATPLTYQLTAQEVELLLGENYLWESSDADLSLTYYADGNANTLDALNLMLGNRYVNNHTPDDVSDREALDILLGR